MQRTLNCNITFWILALYFIFCSIFHSLTRSQKISYLLFRISRHSVRNYNSFLFRDYYIYISVPKKTMPTRSGFWQILFYFLLIHFRSEIIKFPFRKKQCRLPFWILANFVLFFTNSFPFQDYEISVLKLLNFCSGFYRFCSVLRNSFLFQDYNISVPKITMPTSVLDF